MSETTSLATIPDYIAKRNISPEMYSALSNSIFPGAKPESIALAWDYCVARKLDIMKKPCHIVGMSVKNPQNDQYEWRDVIMPGVGELRITAQRTGGYAGQDAPEFGPMIDFKIGNVSVQAPEHCTVTVYRIIDGQRVAFSHTEYFDEACGTTKKGDLNSMWTKRRRGQLAKCAEAGALRKAFPEESGGIITAEEVEGGEMRDVTPAPLNIKTSVASTASEQAESSGTPPHGNQNTSEAEKPALAPAHVVSAEKELGGYKIVLRGTRGEHAVFANEEVGTDAEFLVGGTALVSVVRKGGVLTLVSIKPDQKEEELV